jgi:organic hydroperoxide reductase OsmC/OhrA
MPDTVYSTKVTATGGRHGSVRSEDGLLDLKLALPRTAGRSRKMLSRPDTPSWLRPTIATLS